MWSLFQSTDRQVVVLGILLALVIRTCVEAFGAVAESGRYMGTANVSNRLRRGKRGSTA